MKPGFWDNEDLLDMPSSHRLLFAGLWALADRDGRLEDRPRKIRNKLGIIDLDDPDAALNVLATTGEPEPFITRYEAADEDGKPVKVIQINNFLKHQHIHPREAPGSFPPPQEFSREFPGITGKSGLGPSGTLWDPLGSSGPSAKEEDHVTASGRDRELAAQERVAKEQEKMDVWNRWASGLEGKNGNPASLVRRYIVAFDEAATEYWERRNGRFTATRKAAFAKRMSKFDPDIQLYAMERYVDGHYGTKPEVYAVGIADRARRLSRKELEAEWNAHRNGMRGAGLINTIGA